jgi:hypothetical protein
MAQQLQDIALVSPGHAGINTEEAPLTMSPTFSSRCENAVIDKSGRIASRKGYEMVSSNGATVLGSSVGIESISEFEDQSGTTVLFSCGNNKIFKGTTTLTDITPGSYTISDNNWAFATLANKHYFFQRGHLPLVYDPGTSALTKIVDHSGAAGTPPSANCVMGAFGRLWAADITGTPSTVYWSDSLDGVDWSGGSSGSIDISQVWPDGSDQITALATYQDFFIIFGKRSIVIYSGADNPATMSLSDTVANIGSVGRDTVQSTGMDLLFIDYSGVRSFQRTIRTNTMPVGDISRNVASEFKLFVADADAALIRTIFHPYEGFYLVSFPDLGIVYCFDTRVPLEDGSYRTTTWSGMLPRCFTRTSTDKLYIGVKDVVGEYKGSKDNNLSFELSYFSHPLAFGDSSRLKFLKSVIVTTFNGAGANVTLQWAYDYKQDYTKQVYTLDEDNSGQYNVSQFNTTAQYSSSSVLINQEKVGANGHGSVVQIGLTTTVNGKEIAIQQMNVHSLIGRMA